MQGISAFQIIYKTEAHISVLHKKDAFSANCTLVIRMAQKRKGAGGRNQWNTVFSDLTVAMEHLSNENCWEKWEGLHQIPSVNPCKYSNSYTNSS